VFDQFLELFQKSSYNRYQSPEGGLQSFEKAPLPPQLEELLMPEIRQMREKGVLVSGISCCIYSENKYHYYELRAK
jgi:hypothetical protein